MSDLISKAALFNSIANCSDKAEIFAAIQDAPTVEPAGTPFDGLSEDERLDLAAGLIILRNRVEENAMMGVESEIDPIEKSQKIGGLLERILQKNREEADGK